MIVAKGDEIKENSIEKQDNPEGKQGLDGQQASEKEIVHEQHAPEQEPAAEPVVPAQIIAENPATVQVESPVTNHDLVEVENPGKAEDVQPDPMPVAVEPQVKVEVVQHADIEASLDVFDEVASGDGDVSDPSKSDDDAEPSPESGDGDVTDPVKPSPVNEDLVAAGDSEAGEPMKPEPNKLDVQDSGDGDVTDPVKPATKEEVLVAGDSEAGEPQKPSTDNVDLVSSGDADAGDPVKPAPDQIQAGDSDPAPPSSVEPTLANVAPVPGVAVNVEPVVPVDDLLMDASLDDDDEQDEDSSQSEDSDEKPSPVQQQVSPVDAEVTEHVDLDVINIDADRVSEVQASLIETVAGAGQVDETALEQLLGGDQIKPDNNSLVSAGTTQPVEINEHKDGSYSVTEHEVGKSVVRVYDSEGNLTAEQIDTPNSTTIIEYGSGFNTITIINADGKMYEAVHNDGGGGTLTVTEPDGTTTTVNVDPPSGSGDDSNSGSEGSGSSQQDSSGSDSNSDDDDDNDNDDDDSDNEESETEATDNSSEEESEDGDSSKEQEGTPNPANDDSDAPPLFFVTDGKMGQQEQATVERGIDAAISGGHTDPIEDENTEATLDFLTSEVGQEQAKATESAVEQAQNGGHTDPADDDVDKIDIITVADLEHIDFIIGGGGAADPVDGSGNGGGLPVDGGIVGGGGGPVAEDDDDPDDDDELGPGASMFGPVTASTVHQDIDSIVDAAASFMDVFDLQFNVDADELEDDI